MSGLDQGLRAVEAALFASEEALTVDQIRAHVGESIDIASALKKLQLDYSGRGIELVRRGRSWRFQTAADLAHLLRRERAQLRRLSRAGVETLAIIAYHEPVSRAEIEAGWVRPAGRREVPGRPLVYATTPEFLVHFGLESRRDLPGIAELKAAGLLDPVDEVLDALDAEAGNVPNSDERQVSPVVDDDLLESDGDNA